MAETALSAELVNSREATELASSIQITPGLFCVTFAIDPTSLTNCVVLTAPVGSVVSVVALTASHDA